MAVFLHCIGLSLALSVALISISPIDVVAQRQGDPKCFPGGIAWPDESHAGQVPVVLPDRRVKGAIPAELSTKVLNDEGATYCWYFRLINQLQAWSPCPLEGKSSDITPNGWSTLKVVKIKGIYANKPAQLPVTLALQQKGPYTGSAGCSKWAATKKTKSGSKPPGSIPGQDHLVIVSRGAYFASDNGYISSSKLVTNPSYSSGLMHQGAMNASSQLWDNGLRSLLDDLVVTGCVRHVTFSGHSFGAGGSMLLSVRAAKYLNTKFKQMGRKPPVVTAVMFGISTMGDETFAKEFNKYVNARQVTYPYDPFTFIFQLWTPDNSPPSDLYASIGGVITLNADAMPFQKQVWEKTGDYLTQLMDPSMQIKLTGAGGSAVSKRDAWLSAVHSCSYLCGTSKYAKSAANWCLLHSERGKSGVNASYCFQGYLSMPGQYPTKPQFP